MRLYLLFMALTACGGGSSDSVTPGDLPPSTGVRAQTPVNALTVEDASGLGLKDHPLVFGRPFKSGELKGTPALMVDGVMVESQADIEQRWPDGSVRFAVFSVVLPVVPPRGKVTLTFSSQPTSTAP